MEQSLTGFWWARCVDICLSHLYFYLCTFRQFLPCGENFQLKVANQHSLFDQVWFTHVSYTSGDHLRIEDVAAIGVEQSYNQAVTVYLDVQLDLDITIMDDCKLFP